MSINALPRISQTSVPLTHPLEATDERGHRVVVQIPAERSLTLYVDRVEVVTLMTLGAHPEWLVLGYLLNQNLVRSVHDIEAITVDWEVGAAAVSTHSKGFNAQGRPAAKTVTTGCGQGSMYSDLIDTLKPIGDLPQAIAQQTLLAIVDRVRQQETLYKRAGSVHACALFEGAELRVFIEDVGRHNALDSIAGWRALQAPGFITTHPILYTTGRLTSEMIIKAAQMQVPVVISRSGTTEMAVDVAQRYRVCTVGRALNRRFLCYTHPWRIEFSAEAQTPVSPSLEPLR